MRRLPVPILLLVAVALTASACSFVSPTAYLSINRAPAPMADSLALPATAGSGSAASAAAAKPIAVDMGKTLELVGGSKVTIDLTGSWLAWTPMRFQARAGTWSPAPTIAEWACPSGVHAYFESFKLFGSTGLLSSIDELFAQSTGAMKAFGLQGPDSLKPFVYGIQCLTAYNGKTITLDVPALSTSDRSTYLFVTTTSSALQPMLFEYPNGNRYELPAVGQPIQGTSWVKVNLKQAEPATAPTAKLIARSTPVLLGGGAFTESRTLWREVDARLSTDAQGGALTYSWDLNGDGVYGDVSETPSPIGTLPTGVAIVPDATLAPVAAVGGDATVGVKATNAAGLSSTATTTLKPLPDSSYNQNYRNWFTFDTVTPTVGSALTLTLNMDSEFGGKACIDADADGTYESTVPIAFGGPPATTTFATTALAAGPHEVRVAFIAGYSPTTCTDPAAETYPLVFRQVYASVAARAGAARGTVRASGYSATTTIHLAKGKTLHPASKAPKTMRLDGSVFGGRYRWSTPHRGNGAMRPGAFGAFAGGAYVAQAGKMTVVGGAANEVGVGSGTMLMRGAGANDLLCLAVTSPGPEQTTLILGGTGAGARLQGTLTGGSLMMPYDAIGLVGVTGSGKHTQPEFGQVKPFTNTATLTASTRSARKLPQACRALVVYLPARSGGGGSTTPSVVTG